MMKIMSGADALFLGLETPRSYMHTFKIAILDTASRPDGWSYEWYRELLKRRLHRIPQFRWRYMPAPLGLSHPQWVEDPDFLGEILIYASFALLANHWLGWLVLAYATVFFYSRMFVKDASISRYPGWSLCLVLGTTGRPGTSRQMSRSFGWPSSARRVLCLSVYLTLRPEMSAGSLCYRHPAT